MIDSSSVHQRYHETDICTNKIRLRSLHRHTTSQGGLTATYIACTWETQQDMEPSMLSISLESSTCPRDF